MVYYYWKWFEDYSDASDKGVLNMGEFTFNLIVILLICIVITKK